MISPRIFGGSRARRGLGLVLILAAAFDVSALAAPRRGPTAKNLMLHFGAEGAATDSLRPSERTFLEKAASLSREEVQIAKVAIAQATGADVKTLALQLSTEHQQIADSVESLRRKKGVSIEAPADVVSEAAQKLATKTGADFDREFVRVLGEIHGNAVTLFERAMADAKDTDIRELLGSYLPMLRDHQNKLIELRKAIE